MTETAGTSMPYRLVFGLREAGWDEKSINDFICWMETGKETYLPKPPGGRRREGERLES